MASLNLYINKDKQGNENIGLTYIHLCMTTKTHVQIVHAIARYIHFVEKQSISVKCQAKLYVYLFKIY